MKKSTGCRTGGRIPPVVVTTAAILAASLALTALAQGFQAPAVEVTEGNAASFSVTLPHGMNADIRWEYETEDGTASAGSDYTADTGHLVISAGDTTGAVTIQTTQDNASDDGETFKLRLFNFQMQRSNGQWSKEAVYGIPGEKTITATIKDGT